MRKKVLTSGVSLALVVVLMELFLRGCDPVGVAYYTEARRYHREKLPDDELVYVHQPGLRDTYQGVDVSINALGFRDREVEAKSPGELRVLFLGDSVTFGWGVAEEATFCRRLEVMLGEELGRPVRVINSGNGSYNTVQELAVLRRFNAELQPDMVLLLYTYNDMESKDPFVKRDGPPWYSHKRLRLYALYRHVKKLRSVRAQEAAEAEPAGVAEVGAEDDSAGAPAEPGARFRDGGWRASMQALRDIAAFTRAHDQRFVTFIYRKQSPDLFDETLTDDVEGIARDEGFGVVEVHPNTFAGMDRHQWTNSAVDSHPNALGHRLMAEAMLPVILDNAP